MAEFRFADSDIFEKAKALRREFHKYPEICWQEYRTTARIAEEMESLGYSVIYGKDFLKKDLPLSEEEKNTFKEAAERALADGAKGKYIENIKDGYTGLCAVKKFGTGGPVVMLRFDIDALTIEESCEKEHFPFNNGFLSAYKGISHGCGHDGHTAAGIACAYALEKIKDSINGEVRFVFQPAEEGCQGGIAVSEGGIADDADFFLSGHIGIGLKETGKVAPECYGFLATSKIDAEFKGKSAHAGKTPHEGRNALLSAAAFTLAVSSIPRHGRGNTFVNVGTLNGGSGRNVIADRAFLQLETRGETEELNDYMTDYVLKMAQSCADLYGTEAECRILGKAGDARCDEEMVSIVSEVLAECGLEETPKADFGASEDAVTIMKGVQSHGGKCTYMMFGSRLASAHHSPEFDFDEETLKIMTEVYCRCLEKIMTGQKGE